MIIVEKNEGAKIGYEINGTSVCLDDDLTINLAKRQKDWEVHIDVCSDEDGALVIGAASGRYYVAQFDIPAIEYDVPEVEPATEDGAEMHSEGETPEAKPLDMNKVVMTLWALENRVTVNE